MKEGERKPHYRARALQDLIECTTQATFNTSCRCFSAPNLKSKIDKPVTAHSKIRHTLGVLRRGGWAAASSPLTALKDLQPLPSGLQAGVCDESQSHYTNNNNNNTLLSLLIVHKLFGSTNALSTIWLPEIHYYPWETMITNLTPFFKLQKKKRTLIRMMHRVGSSRIITSVFLQNFPEWDQLPVSASTVCKDVQKNFNHHCKCTLMRYWSET